MAQTHNDRRRPLGVLVKIYPKLSETFILEEILGLERMGLSLRLYSLAPATDAVVHPAVARVRAPWVQVPAPGRAALGGFVARHARLLFDAPLRYLAALAAALARGRRGLHDFVRAGWLAGQLREDGVEHLHSHFISTPADVAELCARLAALPYSISAHAKDIYLSAPADLRRKLQSARFTVSCTDFNCQTLLGIAPQAPVYRMYHGVDHTLFHPKQRGAPQDVPLILSVGRLREKKGLDTLIDACALLHERGQAFACEIVGYGEEQARLQAHIDRRGLAGQVRLLGKLAREQVIARYALRRCTCNRRALPPTATATAFRTCCSKPWRWACRWWRRVSPAFPSWWATCTTACWSSPTRPSCWPPPSPGCWPNPRCAPGSAAAPARP